MMIIIVDDIYAPTSLQIAALVEYAKFHGEEIETRTLKGRFHEEPIFLDDGLSFTPDNRAARREKKYARRTDTSGWDHAVT